MTTARARAKKSTTLIRVGAYSNHYPIGCYFFLRIGLRKRVDGGGFLPAECVSRKSAPKAPPPRRVSFPTGPSRAALFERVSVRPTDLVNTVLLDRQRCAVERDNLRSVQNGIRATVIRERFCADAWKPDNNDRSSDLPRPEHDMYEGGGPISKCILDVSL